MPILPFLNNPKDLDLLDLSYKMDLGLWDCFGRKNVCLTNALLSCNQQRIFHQVHYLNSYRHLMAKQNDEGYSTKFTSTL